MFLLLQVSRVHNFTKAHGQKLIVLDETWWTEPKTVNDLEEDSSLPKCQLDPVTMKDSGAMIIYTAGMTGSSRGFVYNHRGLGGQIDLVASTWDLAASDSVLHGLKLDSVYGAINSLQAPLASGARITLVPANDTMKLWSNILGVGLKSGKTLAKINFFPSIPLVYSSLLKSSAELFKDKKTKEYVKSACGKRVRYKANIENHDRQYMSSLCECTQNLSNLRNFLTQIDGVKHIGTLPFSVSSVEKCYRYGLPSLY